MDYFICRQILDIETDYAVADLIINHIVRGLIMDITHFSMAIANEGYHHFKAVNWVGIPMSWEQSSNEEQKNCLHLKWR